MRKTATSYNKSGKKKNYNGSNVRISDDIFLQVKSYVDEKGLKLGRFAEVALMEKLDKEKK